MGWTDERIELLEKLWKDGLSAGQIAQKLGGLSRNAVLGKLSRRNLLKTRMKPSAPAKAPREPRRTRPAIAPPCDALELPKARLPKPRQPLAGTQPKPWIDREPGECAFPVSGEGAYTHSCCAPVKADYAYCASHHKLMHQPAHKARPKVSTDRLRTDRTDRFAA